MSKEDIVQRILSDADAEAQAIISEAEKRAEEIVESAKVRAAEEMAQTQSEVAEKAEGIAEGKAAAARLDSAKILLGEKRRVIDEVYERAHATLLGLKKRESVALADRLLQSYAEEGDEIVFSAYYAYAEDVAVLPIVKKLKLRIAEERAEMGGGFVLRGAICDKDLSYRALIEADRAAHQAEIAAKLFRGM